MSPLPPLDSMACLDVRRIHQWLAEQTAGMVDDVSLLVGLETPSDNVMLLDAGLVRIESWVTERLGPPGHRTAWASNDYGDVLMLDYPGTGTNRLVALAHYDTVFDTGTVQARPVCVDGDVVRGPGVFDMKGGLVQLVWAVRALDRLGVPRPCVRLVLNGDEEIGSPFSRAILEDVSRGADAALILESSVDGAVKTARKGVGLFRVTATGVEAHAGLEPELGASAVDEIARVVIALHGGADLDQGTSINVGVVRGGSRPNVLAGAATADLDVRVSSATEQARIEDLLASLRPRDERVRLELSGGWNRPVMVRTDGIAQMYELARAAAGQLQVDLHEASVGGASDGNFVAAMGIPVLDGLGAVGAGAHARHEWISIAGMVERAALAAALIAVFVHRDE